jgi:hypothetical protein
MNAKEIKIMEEKWDYLIILDACRFDFFSEIYEKYLDGKLAIKISPGCNTPQWFNNVFKEKYDNIIYISANPYINSKIKIKNVDAKKHFYKIIDVWDTEWNDLLGTVHPREVNIITRKIINDFPNKRLIIHYLQPHEPYLNFNKKIGYPKPQVYLNNVLIGTNTVKFKNLDDSNIYKLMKYIAIIIIGRKKLSKLRLKVSKIFNLKPINPMDAIQRVHGDNGLKKLYKENLEIVLSYVSELIQSLDGIIIVTSDHGELLGEDGYYGHGPSIPHDNPYLRNVPWLKINK